MAQKPEVLCSSDVGVIHIKVIGRATFNIASGLQELVKNLNKNELKSISIDLEDCTGMDSTFMGVLTQLALLALPKRIRPVVINAGDLNISLLGGLGVKKLFDFKTLEYKEFIKNLSNVTGELKDAKTQAEMVLDAHETLIDVDKENEQKFGAVINMIKDELKDMK